MVQSLKKAMQRKGARSRQLLLRRVEGELDTIYDLVQQVFADNAVALQVLQSILKKATRRSRRERYERYLRLWVLRITMECVRRAYPRFVAERLPGQVVPLDFLPLEEKLVYLLTDRALLNGEEIASVLQIPVGRVGRSLAYAREKVARHLLGQGWESSARIALRERIVLNRTLAGRTGCEPYLAAMLAARAYAAGLEARRFSEIEDSIRQKQLLPLLSRHEVVRWQDLSWQYKMGLEASFLGVVGLLVVVVLPWAFSRVDANALMAGNFAQAFRVESQAKESPVVQVISADRLLASSADSEGKQIARSEENDEFANLDFPSGDSYEAGAAPLSPSRQAAAVYRLIVQSPSPKDLIPQVRRLFAEKNVKERSTSGMVMPGGVYFDGITNVGTYPFLSAGIHKLGVTKVYSHDGVGRNPSQKARVIVWVQQI